MQTLPMFKRKFATSTLSFLTVLALWLVPAVSLADNAPCDPNDPNGCPVDSSNYKAPQNSNYNFETMEHAAFCEAVGMSPLTSCLGQSVDQQGKVVSYLYKHTPNGGAVGGINNIMVAMYTNPPTSTVSYLADVGRGFGFITPTYAQTVGGSGEGLIHPIEALWQFARNLAYLVFIIIFMVVGLMIMFRRKINPQTVISIQAALPGLVIGIILVTFSYLIASLLIDLSFLGTQLMAQIFVQIGHNIFNPLQSAAQSNVFHLFTDAIRPEKAVSLGAQVLGTLGSAGNAIGDGGVGGGIGTVIGAAIPSIIGAIIGTILLPGVGTVAGIGIGTGVGAIAGPLVIGLLVPLVLTIALVIQAFRLLFKLINAYIALLIGTITGPFIILAAAIPGRGKVLEFWWRNLLANSLIFPAVFAAFMFAGFILGTDPNAWSTTPVLFGGLSTQLIQIILAYGIILGTPAIPDLVKNALGAKDIQGFDKHSIAGLAAGFAVGRAGFNRGIAHYKGSADTYSKLAQERRAGINNPNTAGANYKRWYGVFGVRPH